MITLVQAMDLPEIKQLDVTIRALRQAIRRQTLAAEKRGRDWFVWERDVVYWVKHSPHYGGKPGNTKSNA